MSDTTVRSYTGVERRVRDEAYYTAAPGRDRRLIPAAGGAAQAIDPIDLALDGVPDEDKGQLAHHLGAGATHLRAHAEDAHGDAAELHAQSEHAATVKYFGGNAAAARAAGFDKSNEHYGEKRHDAAADDVTTVRTPWDGINRRRRPSNYPYDGTDRRNA